MLLKHLMCSFYCENAIRGFGNLLCNIFAGNLRMRCSVGVSSNGWDLILISTLALFNEKIKTNFHCHLEKTVTNVNKQGMRFINTIFSSTFFVHLLNDGSFLCTNRIFKR